MIVLDASAQPPAMIRWSCFLPWQQLDHTGPAGDHDAFAAVTPLSGT
jgi:hypothetical protein